eukprot:m.124275 g.124275  ORF g.124275 m.124275 type:complete len:154 (-) comp11150_c6_seq1:2163-2624(-)
MSKVAKLHIRQPDDDEVEHERLLNEDDHNGNYEDDGDDILHQSVGDARRGSLDAPRDAYNAAYMIFYLQGLGTLIPWNAFITVNAYFDEKLEQSHYKNNVLPYFTTSFQIVNILLLVFATKVRPWLCSYISLPCSSAMFGWCVEVEAAQCSGR